MSRMVFFNFVITKIYFVPAKKRAFLEWHELFRTKWGIRLMINLTWAHFKRLTIKGSEWDPIFWIVSFWICYSVAVLCIANLEITHFLEKNESINYQPSDKWKYNLKLSLKRRYDSILYNWKDWIKIVYQKMIRMKNTYDYQVNSIKIPETTSMN